MSIASKSQILERCNIDFLRALATEINFSYQNYREKGKEELLEILSRKLSTQEIDVIFKAYLLCLDGSEAAKMIRSTGIHEIVNAVECFLECDEYLHEVTVGRLRCDLIGLRNDLIIAVEVKSARDAIVRAVKQTSYYMRWANEVYLAYDEAHKGRVKTLPFEQCGVGLLEISRKGSISLVSQPRHHQPDPFTTLSLIRSDFVRQLARGYNLSTKGKKKEIAEALSARVDNKTLLQILKIYLKSRTSISRGRVARRSFESERTYPLTQF